MSIAFTPLARRLGGGLLLLCGAVLLSACGGGEDPASAASGTAAGAGTSGSVAAPLVLSLATPAALNGTLDKAGALFESNSSNATLSTYASTDPYCRVAAYSMANSGDRLKYSVELSFRKGDLSVGQVNVGRDGTSGAFAYVATPATGVSVDLAQRRVVFTNLAFSSAGGSFTLNGTLEYPSNVAPENRAACG